MSDLTLLLLLPLLVMIKKFTANIIVFCHICKKNV